MTNTRRRPTALVRLLGALFRPAAPGRTGRGAASSTRKQGSTASASPTPASTSRARAGTAPSPSGVRSSADRLDSPGRTGPAATVEVEPAKLRGVRLAYAPDDDDQPDPGEIVWTWVPFEERDGRGKDRPVVVVAADGRGAYLAVQLTSKAHADDRDYLALGSGAWDASGRGSWVDLGRVFTVRPGGIRREAAALDAKRYGLVANALRERYGWA